MNLFIEQFMCVCVYVYINFDWTVFFFWNFIFVDGKTCFWLLVNTRTSFLRVLLLLFCYTTFFFFSAIPTEQLNRFLRATRTGPTLVFFFFFVKDQYPHRVTVVIFWLPSWFSLLAFVYFFSSVKTSRTEIIARKFFFQQWKSSSHWLFRSTDFYFFLCAHQLYMFLLVGILWFWRFRIFQQEPRFRWQYYFCYQRQFKNLRLLKLNGHRHDCFEIQITSWEKSELLQ